MKEEEKKKRKKSQPVSPKLYFQLIRSHCSRVHFWEETELTGSEDNTPGNMFVWFGEYSDMNGGRFGSFFLVDGMVSVGGCSKVPVVFVVTIKSSRECEALLVLSRVY